MKMFPKNSILEALIMKSKIKCHFLPYSYHRKCYFCGILAV